MHGDSLCIESAQFLELKPAIRRQAEQLADLFTQFADGAEPSGVRYALPL